MPVDPAKFIIRSLAYPQNSAYPKNCASITEEALGRNFHNINDLVHYVASRLNAHTDESHSSAIYSILRDQMPDESDGEDKKCINPTDPWKRDINTRLIPRYRPAVARAMRRLQQLQAQKQLPDDIEYTENQWEYNGHAERIQQVRFFYHHDGHRIPLSEIVFSESPRDEGMNNIFHPSTFGLDHKDAPNPQRTCSDELRWSAIAQTFAAAMNPENSKTAREEQALTCYCLLSHDVPLKNGSASLARIALEYMAQQIGFDVPFIKRNYDLNMEAITRTPKEFVQAWRNREFFDPDVTSAQIMQWQEYAIRKQSMLPSRPGYYR